MDAKIRDAVLTIARDNVELIANIERLRAVVDRVGRYWDSEPTLDLTAVEAHLGRKVFDLFQEASEDEEPEEDDRE